MVPCNETTLIRKKIMLKTSLYNELNWIYSPYSATELPKGDCEEPRLFSRWLFYPSMGSNIHESVFNVLIRFLSFSPVLLQSSVVFVQLLATPNPTTIPHLISVSRCLPKVCIQLSSFLPEVLPSQQDCRLICWKAVKFQTTGKTSACVCDAVTANNYVSFSFYIVATVFRNF